MKYLRSYKIFEMQIQTNKFDIGIENDFEVLKEILYDLKFDYFDVSYISTCFRDSDYNTFNALERSILRWENANTSFKLQGLDPLDKVENIIICSIKIDPGFYYKDIKSYVEESIQFMLNKGWRYLIEPVANNDSTGYYLLDIKDIEQQKIVSLHIKFYC